jgi:hypothetical protein
LNNY